MPSCYHWKSIVLIVLLTAACQGTSNKQKTETTETSIDYTKVSIPDFQADSAYLFVKKQVDFGPRVPGTKAHSHCAEYLSSALSNWADTVIIQPFTTSLYNNTQVSGKNIIASFSPEKNTRILLGAHWDSRMFADHDPNPDNYLKPILGANDGASGVGVLMEIARLLKNEKPNVGIDIIFFDVEDQGTPEFEHSITKEDTWCLGSQYWAKNKHTPYYQAKYGILLDMVGSHKPRFTMEEVSMHFASPIVNKVWKIAEQLGHKSVFLQKKSGGIIDDHLYVNRYANIPMIDIVQQSSNGGFFEYWHTVNDNMDVINKETLKIVGDVVLTTIFSE